MPTTWRKGCLCGCLTPDECDYYEPPAQVVHVVHHVVAHHPAAALPEDYVEGEVVEDSWNP